ncbi:MAG: hypothetical protein ACRDND_17665, partial [Streptosporangiaceae bacterium]
MGSPSQDGHQVQRPSAPPPTSPATTRAPWPGCCSGCGWRARRRWQVVRRVLLRRSIAIDAETAQLAPAAVQAVLQA